MVGHAAMSEKTGTLVKNTNGAGIWSTGVQAGLGKHERMLKLHFQKDGNGEDSQLLES